MLTYKLTVEIARCTKRARAQTSGQRQLFAEKVIQIIDNNNPPYEVSTRCRRELYNSEAFCDEAGIPFRRAFEYLDIMTTGMHMHFLETNPNGN